MGQIVKVGEDVVRKIMTNKRNGQDVERNKTELILKLSEY